MKTITVALTAVLATGTVQAFEPAKWQDPGIIRLQQQEGAVRKGKLILAKKKDHSKDNVKSTKKPKK